MSGEHNHPDYEEAIISLTERVLALETEPIDPEPPEPEPSSYLWEADYSVSPWWKNHGIIREDFPASHDLATRVTNNAIEVTCLPGTTLDTGGCCYGFTDRCGFAELGLIEDNAVGMREVYSKIYFMLPDNWCDTEDDVRWRTRTGSCKLPNTFCSFDPSHGIMSQPYSNNFAPLAYASSLGAIIKGPPGATDYDRDRSRPSTFFSVTSAGGWKRQPQPNGQAVSMIQFYWHLNPNPKDLTTGVGSGSKPFVFLTRGVWHSFETYIRANSAGKPDGEYKAWFDNDLAMHITDLQLMPTIARGINGWHNQYFHGGPEGCDKQQKMFLGAAAFDDKSLAEF